MSIEACKLIHFKKIGDPNGRGNLTPIEGGKDLPFMPMRIYYLYDVPGGSTRGGHAHKTMHQVLIAMSGSFDVIVHDGDTSMRYHLNRSYYGLYIPNMLWRELDNFSSGAVCLSIASTPFDEDDYYRDFKDFKRAVNG